jgi:hypothetical protein
VRLPLKLKLSRVFRHTVDFLRLQRAELVDPHSFAVLSTVRLPLKLKLSRRFWVVFEFIEATTFRFCSSAVLNGLLPTVGGGGGGAGGFIFLAIVCKKPPYFGKNFKKLLGCISTAVSLVLL